MTTPDYAGLIEELRELAKSCGYEYGTESGTTAWNAATALRTLLESNAALEARVKELEAENARLRERQAEADRVIDMVEEDPALARSLARSYRDKGSAAHD